MSNQSPKNQNQSDEIDLSVIFDKIVSFFKSLLLGVVMIFRFFWNHKILLIILLILGFGLQLLLKNNLQNIYVNEFLVRTNFSSAEYLYSKAESVNSKLNSNDTLYLENVFGNDYKRVVKVEVNPVVDIYQLVSKTPENKEIFKLLYDEYGDISFLEENINVNQYPTHKINIFIKGQQNNVGISKRLYDFVSNNPHFNNLKKIALKSYQEQLDENIIIKSQIDSILEDQQRNNVLPKLENNLLNLSGSQDLSGLLTQKRSLINDNFRLRTLLVNDKDLFKIIDSSFGIYSEEQNNINYIYSFIFILIYCLFYFVKFLIKRILKFIEN